ncbi:MAG TPA: glucose-6-phosphate isomerase [Alphaproteobacteria bacterium]|nr:glucose-6-phosphate isomerase [Alphaproteobacteria bacterium]
MPYHQDISACFGTGALALDERIFAELLAGTAEALDALRLARAEGSLPLLALPGRRDDLDALKPHADRFRALCDDVVVLGTGGSSLGGQAIHGFASPGATPRLHFLDNIDPEHFEAILNALDFARTGVIAISKSGGTAETMTQLLAVLPRLAGGEDRLGERVAAITMPGDSPLRRLALRYGLTVLDHDPDIGGRFAALSLVGLLPAMIADLDAAAVREGAAAVLDQALGCDDPSLVPPAIGAALNVGLARAHGISQTVLLPYSDRLEPFARWFRQLWAESLGKQGRGTTPVPAVGAVDQHSQLQLWLDGPADKLFTIIMADRAGTGARIDPALAEDLLAADGPLNWLAGRTMGDLMEAEQRATAETLSAAGRPVRIIAMKSIDLRALGALMMHYMLETVIAAHLLGVDPFDQPAVEEGKVLARRYLQEMPRARG